MKYKNDPLFAPLILAAALCLGIVAGFGCKQTLEQGGAYAPVTTNAAGQIEVIQAPDLAFFEVDFAFDALYNLADTAFSFERNNRAVLWKLSPDIKHTLDQVRPSFDQAAREYALARQAYLQNPIPANLDTLGTILARMKAISAAAQAAISNQTP